MAITGTRRIAFQPGIFFTDEEDQFITVGSSDPWSYNWTPDDGEYDITSRGRTSDQPKTSGGADSGVGGPESTAVSLIKNNQSPLMTILNPARNLGSNESAAYPLRITADDGLGSGGTGTGVHKVWFILMTTAPLTNETTNQYITGKDPATWVSWCRNVYTMPGCTTPAANAWGWDTTTQAHALDSPPPPAAILPWWAGKFTFRNVSVDPDLRPGPNPERLDGKEYYIAAISSDALANVGNGVGTSETFTPTGSWADAYPLANQGYRFIYDVTIPTVTGHASIVDLSSSAAAPTVLNAMTVASGTIADNVFAVSAQLRIFLRVQDTVTGKYMNPNTLLKFDQPSAGAAWAEVDRSTNSWDFDLSLTQFVDGNMYKVELYAEDGAGNRDQNQCPFVSTSPATACRTGSTAIPKYIRYFKRDKVVPTSKVTAPLPVVGSSDKLGGNLTQITGTAADAGTGVEYVEYSLRFNAADPTSRWLHHISSGEWKTNTLSEIWNRACDSAVGCGTPGGTWAVWVSSNLALLDGQDYVFAIRSGLRRKHLLGASITFTLDRSSRRPP